MVEPATTANAGPLSKHIVGLVLKKAEDTYDNIEKDEQNQVASPHVRMYSYLCIPILRLRRELGL